MVSATARTAAVDALITGSPNTPPRSGPVTTRPTSKASIVQLDRQQFHAGIRRQSPASVLSAFGVDQRFTDKAHRELAPRPPTWRNHRTSAADADIVYLSCASEAGRGTRGRHPDMTRRSCPPTVTTGFVTNDQVWQTGEGMVAACGIVDDLRWVDAP